MKLQLTSIVTLAILYGKVKASPIPKEEVLPSFFDTLANAVGSGVSTAYQLAVPGAAVKGALGAAGCVQLQGGGYYCPQKREDESEEVLPSLFDTLANAVGSGVSTAYQLAVPGAAVKGALGAAGCVQLQGGGYYCPQKREDESEEVLPSLFDTLANAVGSGVSTAYQLAVPGAAVNGALGAAGCVQLQGGGYYCPQKREDESEEVLPSLFDTLANAVGNGVSTAYQLAVPGAAVNGALGAAGCVQLQGGGYYCPPS